jgi:hypothetical protein
MTVPAYASSVYPTSLPSATTAAKAFFQSGDNDDKKEEEQVGAPTVPSAVI